ncbi:hypothetical protein PVA38_08865 [Streptococcus pneumoniae D39]|nr:hypothetical protein PVA38_08865 [Streptococcus pneumoniae D39]
MFTAIPNKTKGPIRSKIPPTRPTIPLIKACLLYTSDAADEARSVDLGGRRIFKKKKNIEL